ncbi:MAG TPA: lipoyl(octanoyl) transferase LipB [Solirubrobacterales bacterium]|nr:lipoyl(octanoyl) transferase LipB [Solirubrobacterales bacterium]
MTAPVPPRRVRWSFLGRVPYGEALELQVASREVVKRGEGEERLLLLEHPHVYTLGRNASPADVLAPPEWLAARGVAVVECDRGGQVTYHGPGQLVGYPVVNLSPDRRDIRRYVRDLQEVLVRTLADYGVAAVPGREQENIGVWTAGPEPGHEPAKIASLGIHLSRWVRTHGFALNVTTDLAMFAGIIPCGLRAVRMTSIAQETGRAPGLAEVAARVAAHFGEVFGREMVPEGEETAGPAEPAPVATAGVP